MQRMIDLVRKSEVPSNLMYAAARGALAVSPAEAIEILVHLATHNKVFGDEARITLAGWDERASIAAASDPSTSREVLEYLISPNNLRPPLLPALIENSSVPADLLIPLARDGTREVIEVLLRSDRIRSIPAVVEGLRANPNLTNEEMKQLPALEEPVTPELLGDDGVAENEELEKFLREHAAEIEAEGRKPFQPIGGVQEEIELAVQTEPEEAPVAEPVASVAEPAASATEPDASVSESPAPATKPEVPDNATVVAPVTKPKTIPALARGPKKPVAGEKRDSTLQKIARLDIKGRIQLAMKGTKEERSLLVRDGTKLVALAVLESPKISDGEVERIASQKNVLEAVLRQIPMKRRYAKQYTIIRNLVFNPRTPMDVSLGLVKNLLVTDLKNLSGNKEVSETIRKMALRMLKQKADAAGKK